MTPDDLRVLPGCGRRQEMRGMATWKHGYALANAHECVHCLALLVSAVKDGALEGAAKIARKAFVHGAHWSAGHLNRLAAITLSDAEAWRRYPDPSVIPSKPQEEK